MLAHSATVYLPSVTRDGQPVTNHEELLQDTISSMIDLAGGATVTQGTGYWQGDHGLAVEEVTLIQSYCEDLMSIHSQLVNLCQHLASQANQEAVSLALDSELHFIGGLS